MGQYISSRSQNKQNACSLAEAVFKGLADDGGLFMPAEWKRLTAAEWQEMSNLALPEIAVKTLETIIGNEIPQHNLQQICQHAFNFPMPLIEIEKNVYSLELFHGPTLAFKDVGARFMAALLGYFGVASKKKIKIIVATSGDTGSAVAAGFYGVNGVEVYILYPQGKVSKLQEKQLTTWGCNITAIELKGSFDDCQNIVKQLLNDFELQQSAIITSANSINIARLLPQAVYYVYAWSRLKHLNKPIIFSVPSGNFGNLTAGLMAQKMGLPIEHFIAASNANNAVPNYLKTGNFTPRPAIATISNAMDVGNPSNFERMLFLFNNDHFSMKKSVSGYSFSDKQTKNAMVDVYSASSYTLDPHGAIAYLGLKKHLKQMPLNALGVLFETAHPSKFAETVATILNRPIELPHSLQAFAEREKISIECENDYEHVKQLLLMHG